MTSQMSTFWRFRRDANTLLHDTTPTQWHRYRKMGVFGTARAKTWLGFYINDGTIKGWVLATVVIPFVSLRRPKEVEP